MCPEAALSWNYVLGHTGVEVQINQKAGPDAKGEKDAQAWYGSFLLYGEKVRSLKRGQLGSWQGTLPFTEPLGSPQAELSKSSYLEVPRPLGRADAVGAEPAQAGVDGNAPWSTAFGMTGHPIETRGLQGSTYPRS